MTKDELTAAIETLGRTNMDTLADLEQRFVAELDALGLPHDEFRYTITSDQVRALLCAGVPYEQLVELDSVRIDSHDIDFTTERTVGNLTVSALYFAHLPQDVKDLLVACGKLTQEHSDYLAVNC